MEVETVVGDGSIRKTSIDFEVFEEGGDVFFEGGSSGHGWFLIFEVE